MSETALHPAYRYDRAEPRQSLRHGRERGCWVYIPRDELVDAGLSPDDPAPLYRLTALATTKKSSPRVIVNLYPAP